MTEKNEHIENDEHVGKAVYIRYNNYNRSIMMIAIIALIAGIGSHYITKKYYTTQKTSVLINKKTQPPKRPKTISTVISVETHRKQRPKKKQKIFKARKKRYHRKRRYYKHRKKRKIVHFKRSSKNIKKSVKKKPIDKREKPKPRIKVVILPPKPPKRKVLKVIKKIAPKPRYRRIARYQKPPYFTTTFKITHHSKMGKSFVVEEISYWLDHRVIYHKKRGLFFGLKKNFVVYKKNITSGKHHLKIQIKARGEGFGPFSYLRKYKFLLKKQRKINIDKRIPFNIKVTVVDKGGMIFTERLKLKIL